MTTTITPLVIIDTRESDQLCKLLVTKNVSFSRRCLSCGDFLFQHEEFQVVIERKTYKDLYASIQDGRFRDQRHRLLQWKNNHQKVLYLIEDENETHHDIKVMLRRTLYRLMIAYDIPVIWTCSLIDTVDWIQWMSEQDLPSMFRQRDSTLSTNMMMRKKDVVTPHHVIICLLTSIHGISYEMAVQMAQGHSSVHDFLEALYHDVKYPSSPVRYQTKDGRDRPISNKIWQQVRQLCFSSSDGDMITPTTLPPANIMTKPLGRLLTRQNVS